jgi:hypothetical protein
MRSALRCFLIAVLFVVCLSTLHLRAQEPSGPSKIDEAAPLALFLASISAQPAKPINPKVLCGGAGQTCCAGGACNAGLACNANNICRTCGGNGNICCPGNTCATGLACAGGRCSPCGYYGLYCCPYFPQCFEGTCKIPGTCQP